VFLTGVPSTDRGGISDTISRWDAGSFGPEDLELARFCDINAAMWRILDLDSMSLHVLKVHIGIAGRTEANAPILSLGTHPC
jgi:hypothetical protein